MGSHFGDQGFVRFDIVDNFASWHMALSGGGSPVLLAVIQQRGANEENVYGDCQGEGRLLQHALKAQRIFPIRIKVAASVVKVCRYSVMK